MKNRKAVCVINGNNGLVAVVEGPISPALSILRKKFEKTYNLDIEENGSVPQATTIMKRVVAMQKAIERLRGEGLEGHDIPNLFVAWLCANYEFNVVDIDRFVINF